MSLGVLTCPVPILISQLHESLETSDIGTTVTTESSSLVAIRVSKMGLSSPKNCYYLICLEDPWKNPGTGCVIIWSVRKSPIIRALVKKSMAIFKNCSCLRWQYTLGQIRGLLKSWKKHLGMSIRGFEKITYSCGFRRQHICIRLHISHLWLTLRLYASRKWRVSQNCKLLEYGRHTTICVPPPQQGVGGRIKFWKNLRNSLFNY